MAECGENSAPSWPALDKEALALIACAEPLPALPADFPTRTLDAAVPIDFSPNG